MLGMNSSRLLYLISIWMYSWMALPLLLSSLYSLDMILIVSATPTHHTNPGGVVELLSKQEDVGKINKFQSKSNIQPPVAEFQLEQLKLNPTKMTSVEETTPVVIKGTLNLETPVVSDNSQPQPESYSSGTVTDYDKIVSLSKVDSDKRIVVETPEKSTTRLKIEMDYTPQDLAEYIFWTGDEPGVVSALNDFLQDELVDKDEVIKFLEDVKIELKLLKSRYETVVTTRPQDNLENIKFKEGTKQLPLVMTNPGPTSFSQIEKRRDKRIAKNENNNKNENNEDIEYTNEFDIKKFGGGSEDILQEIIYRLAKELFLDRRVGQNLIQKFESYVEDVRSSKHMPKDLEKKVIDTLVAALADSVNEIDNPNRRSNLNHVIQSKFRNVVPPQQESQNIMKH